MKLTKRERQLLRAAIAEAIESTKSLIDAHRIGYSRRKGDHQMIIPAEYRNQVRIWQRRIAAWNRLMTRLREPPTPS